MTGLHNTQRAPARKVWRDCPFCEGSGLTIRSFNRGFFSYDAGVTCPECNSKHQSELKAQQTMNELVDSPYPPPHADEVRITARLNAMDAKLDAILKKLGST